MTQFQSHSPLLLPPPHHAPGPGKVAGTLAPMFRMKWKASQAKGRLAPTQPDPALGLLPSASARSPGRASDLMPSRAPAPRKA